MIDLRCKNPLCNRNVREHMSGRATEYCCTPCRAAHEGKWELTDEDTGPLGHRDYCNERYVGEITDKQMILSTTVDTDGFYERITGSNVAGNLTEKDLKFFIKKTWPNKPLWEENDGS